jgi:hypothetical protein
VVAGRAGRSSGIVPLWPPASSSTAKSSNGGATFSFLRLRHGAVVRVVVKADKQQSCYCSSCCYASGTIRCRNNKQKEASIIIVLFSRSIAEPGETRSSGESQGNCLVCFPITGAVSVSRPSTNGAALTERFLSNVRVFHRRRHRTKRGGSETLTLAKKRCQLLLAVVIIFKHLLNRFQYCL